MTVPSPATSPFTGGWNEAFAAPGRLRPLYGSLLPELEHVDMASLTAAVAEWMEDAQATFGRDPLVVCPVPRLIESDEWNALSAGIAQRVRALSAFVADAYNSREIVSAGLVPASVIDGAEGYEPELRGRWPVRSAPLGVVGLDVVRDRDSKLYALEDNARTPSGFAYAVAARHAVTTTLDDLAPSVAGTMPPPVALEPATVAALRDGDGGPARPIDVVYRRTDVDTLRDEHGARTPVAEVLLDPWLAGKLAVVNAFGTGVADDKLAHAYVEQMIRFYLGGAPLLPSVATLDLNDPIVLEHVLGDLRAHVIKARYGHGGHGVVVCAHAAAADVQRMEAALREPNAGAKYVAQPTLALSLHPTIIDGGLAQRHIDLRPFAFATRDSVKVVPGGLTRVAREAGSLVVNSSQDGGAKDIWVLT
jgi:uncharacterized circularly permuted ATP-grasp superfamily protein